MIKRSKKSKLTPNITLFDVWVFVNVMVMAVVMATMLAASATISSPSSRLFCTTSKQHARDLSKSEKHTEGTHKKQNIIRSNYS